MKKALVIWFFVVALVAMGCSPPPDSFGSMGTQVDSDPGAIQLLGDHTDAGTMVASGVLSTPYARQLARASDGALYCVYYRSDGTYTQIYGSKSVDGGQTWTEEQITTAPLYHYQPSIAIDSDDNLHVAWIVFPDGDPIDQSYGYLWPGYPGHPGRVSTVQYRVKTTGWQSIENVKTGYHTVLSMALDSDDNVHLAIAGHNPGAWNCAGISYARRTASGWDPVERISSGCWTGVAAIAVDVNNNAHVVWPHRPYGDGRTEIIYRQRTSSGWESEVQLQSFDNYWSGGLSIATDSNNQIHVVWGWQERQGDHYGIRCRRFTTYWHPIEMIEGPTLLLQNIPTIAIDGNDHIHIVWSGRHVDSPDLFQLRHREYASAWQQIENLTSSTSEDQANPNLMWASHPAVAGVKTNQMAEGYSLVWMDGTTIRYSSTLIVEYDLTIASTDGGSVTQPGEGTYTYEDGAVVDLVAVPDTGYGFANWTGDVSTINNVHAPETTITINDDYSIIANFAVTPPWPMFGQNAKRTGRSPYAGPETPGLRWSFTTQGWVTSSPAIGVDGTIYVGAHDYNLYAMNPDGSEKWRFTTGNSIYNSSPAIGPDGTVYVGSADGKIYAIDPDGSERWSFTTGGSIFSSPVTGVDGTIYVGSDDNNLYALRPDGDEEWRFATGDDVRSSPAIGIDGTIYVGSDYNLYALDPDGGEKWRFTTGEPVSVAPSIGADGMVYVGSQDGNLYAIDPDGDEKWRFTTGGVILSSPGIGIDGTVYVGSNDNNLYAINPDGSEKWRFTTGGSVLSSPAICANGIIYVGSGDNKLYAVDPDGSKKWSFTTGDWVTSSPAIGADGTIYVGSWDYRLYAIMEAPEYDLSISSTEGGEVTDPGEGTFTYAYGSVVNLVATPDTGHQFVNWTGDVGSVDSVDSAETTITMHDDYAIIANFAINTYTLTYSAGPGGSITGTTPQTVSHGSDGTPVEAVPDTGYHFVDWSDSSTDNPRTDTNVTADITVTANFAIDEHGLTISSTNGGSVTAPGEGTYPYAYGTVVNLVATPAMGYGFVNWTGDVGTIVAVNSTTTTITMNDDYSITANFEPVAGVQTQCVESATNTGEACFTTSHGFIEDFQAIPPHSLPSVLFPHGMFDFRITGLTPGQTVTLTIEFPSPLPIGTLWWKYDNGRWYGLPNESDNGDNIMVISLTDGGVHDLDDVPGQITDPGGPGNPMTVGWEGSPIRRSAVAAPWLALLAVALCGASILVLRRRSEGRRDF